MERTEKELIVSTLKDLTQAISNIYTQVDHMQNFMQGNFRTFHEIHYNTYGVLAAAQTNIQHLEQTLLSNAEQAHRLSPTEDVGRDENGNYRRGEVPQQATSYTPWGYTEF
jgi:hypothetical protein